MKKMQRSTRGLRQATYKKNENRQCGQILYNLPLETSVTQRLALYRVLQMKEGKARFEACNFSMNVALKKLIGGESGEKQSASATIQIVAEYVGQNFGSGKRDFMYKISFAPTAENDDNSLEVERLIYKNVVNPLILQRQSPFLVAFYGEIQSKCSLKDFQRGLPTEKERDSFYTFIEKLIELQKYDLRKMNILITERAMGRQVSELQNLTEKQFLEILFQVLWTLVCFRDVGLVHNDLHSENVFVSPLQTPQTLFFAGDGGKIIGVKTTLMTQIFDFDYSSKVRTAHSDCEIRNTKLEQKLNGKPPLCERAGLCNTYDERRDITRFLSYIIAYNDDSHKIRRWVNNLNIIDVDFVLTRLSGDNVTKKGYAAWDGNICEVVTEGTKCKTFPHIEKRVMSLAHMMGEVVGRMDDLNMIESFDTWNENGEIPCDVDRLYVPPSLMDKYKLNRCASTKRKRSPQSFGQDQCRRKMRQRK